MLEAGKNVLCEKPMGLTLRQNKEVLELAKQKGLFYMEVRWQAIMHSRTIVGILKNHSTAKYTCLGRSSIGQQ